LWGFCFGGLLSKNESTRAQFRLTPRRFCYYYAYGD